MRRILALILAAVMLTAVCVPVQAEAYTFYVTLSADDVKGGERLCLTVNFGELPTVGLCGCEMQIKYDKDVITFAKAEVEGFPKDTGWMTAVKTKNGVATVNTFDDAAVVTHVYDGTEACIKLYFDTVKGTARTVSFEVVSGSVQGCYFDKGIISYNGFGGSTACEIYSFPTLSGDGWYLNDGYLYCEADTVIGDVSVEGTVIGKGDADTFATGDVFVTEQYRDIAVGVLYDVNADGYVTTADCVALRLYIKLEAAPSDSAFIAADVNMDGALTAADTLLFLAYLSER